MKTTCFTLAAAAATLLLAAGGAAAQPAGCAVALSPSIPAPQLVGQRITWTATATGCGAAPVFRFSVAGPAHFHFSTRRDYSLDGSFAWAPLEEGLYAVKVHVKEGFAASESKAAAAFDLVRPRATAGNAVVTPTAHPLVALYSAPACHEGPVRVRFRPADEADAPWKSTASLPCEPGRSRNFLVAGLRANTTYAMVHQRERGQGSAPVLLFTTGAPPLTVDIPAFTVPQPPGPDADGRDDVLFHNLAGRPAANAVNLLATDLEGHVLWYYDPLPSGLVAIGLPGSTLLPGGIVMLGGRDRHATSGLNVMREVDLAGNPVRETNVDAVNAQLLARGQEVIYGFHHEFLPLPDGHLATLGWTQRTIPVGPPQTPTRYAGDMLIVLDRDLQVVWTWNAFDHLDVTRGPVLGELCTGAPCPLNGAVDWLHDNTISLSPRDGDLLISVRHQDWVIKIDYRHGRGDGHVVWRLGPGGDFDLAGAGDDAWFTHQHYPHYLADGRTLLLFDNGNTRQATDPSVHSRGQAWRLDEEAMTATPVVNFDVGNYSDSLGTADVKRNGSFVFDSGSQGLPPAQFGQSIEIRPDGSIVYVQQVAARDYRSFRLRDLYHGAAH